MKNLITVCFVCIQVLLFAQAPEGVNYQAVIRNNSGDVLSNNNVGLQISLYKNTAGGTLVYQESFQTTTDNFGLVNLVIGQGLNISGSFESVDWSNGPFFIEIATDENGGANYEVIGSQELMSVPYALYAKTAGNGPQGIQGETGAQGIQGEIGPQGVQGEQGIQGNTGPQGTQGDTGPQGTQGDTGPQGEQGIQGDVGPQGIQGVQGEQGVQGDVGPQGIQGNTGNDGNDGLLPNGTAIGNTTFWDGTEWVVDDNNLFNSGGNVGLGTTSPAAKLEVSGGDIAISSPFKYKVKDATDGDNFLMYEPTIDGLRLNGYDAVFITTTDGTNATAGQDLVVRNGRVGINTNTPSQGLLHVNGYYSDPFGNFTYYATGPNTGTAAGTNLNTSIFATHRVVAGEFNAISDARIKNIEGVSNAAKDLETLNKIEVTDYHMIDPSHGEKPVKKAIAQQLEGIYPQAVSKSTNCIPDIYELSECISGSIKIENELIPGERIRLIFDDSEEIATVVSANAHSIETNLNKTGKVFIYGREVDDFRTVDYQAISMLNVSATQALLKRIEALEKENKSLKKVNEDMNTLKAELDVLQKNVILLMNEKNTASYPKEK
ncbi:hypothetical protein OAP32_00955 [Crocinitomicaceae bacterium]|nr:hypothetical protein [Crocinitomicaceae bacterium]